MIDQLREKRMRAKRAEAARVLPLPCHMRSSHPLWEYMRYKPLDPGEEANGGYLCRCGRFLAVDHHQLAAAEHKLEFHFQVSVVVRPLK